jgi:hypothetical protein
MQGFIFSAAGKRVPVGFLAVVLPDFPRGKPARPEKSFQPLRINAAPVFD